MFLNEAALCNFLEYKGLLHSKQLALHKISIRRQFSRNRNFVFSIDETKGFFIKQPDDYTNNKKRSSFNEANCYWLIKNKKLFAPLGQYTCRYIEFFPAKQLLVIEKCNDSNLFIQLAGKTPSPAQSKAIAKGLGAFHSIEPDAVTMPDVHCLFKKDIPWVFYAGAKRDKNLSLNSREEKHFIDSFQNYRELIYAINAAKRKWKQTCFIHGDIRLSNVLYNEKNKKMLFVDLEHADIGDPCWDTGSYFQTLLMQSIYTNYHETVIRSEMKNSASEFWEVYCRHRKLKKSEQLIQLNKSIEYSGMRMLQLCFELMKPDGTLDANTTRMFAVSKEILNNPAKTAANLFGL